jgi:very-short-patch-repair endonuclease
VTRPAKFSDRFFNLGELTYHKGWDNMYSINGNQYVTTTQASKFFNVTPAVFKMFYHRHKDHLHDIGAVINVDKETKQRLGLAYRTTYLYGFEALLIFHARSHYRDVSNVFELCKLFNEDVTQWINRIEFEYSKEQAFAVKLNQALNGITTIHQHYNVGNFFVDFYLPKYNLAIEFDEFAHKYQLDEDSERQKYIEDKLKCKFVRVGENEEFSLALNKILLNIL